MSAASYPSEQTQTAKPYGRVLLKLSGEVLMGDSPYGIDLDTLERMAKDIAEVVNSGIQLCLVIGGGNIFRGLSLASKGMDRASADYMGMLATVMNALAMQSALEKIDTLLKEQGLGMKDVVMMHVYLVGDPKKGNTLDFAGLQASYTKFFGTAEPFPKGRVRPFLPEYRVRHDDRSMNESVLARQRTRLRTGCRDTADSRRTAHPHRCPKARRSPNFSPAGKSNRSESRRNRQRVPPSPARPTAAAQRHPDSTELRHDRIRNAEPMIARDPVRCTIGPPDGRTQSKKS